MLLKFLDVMNRQVNISSLIFLKLFERTVCSNIFIKNQKIPYPIHYLCYKYGMLNSFVSDDLTKLNIIFDNRKCFDDKNLTNKEYYNIIDMFINSPCFYSIDRQEAITIITLSFDKIFLKDIEMISQTSKFSKVSDAFVNHMKPISKFVPEIDNSFIRFIIIKNIPYNIVSWNSKLSDLISEIYRVKLNKKDHELFITFQPKKEYLSNQNLENIQNNSIFEC